MSNIEKVKKTAAAITLVGGEFHLHPDPDPLCIDDPLRAVISFSQHFYQEDEVDLWFDIRGSAYDPGHQTIIARGRPFAVHEIAIHVGRHLCEHGSLLPTLEPRVEARLPPQYLKTIHVDHDDPTWHDTLRVQVTNILSGLNPDGMRYWNTVDDVILDYRRDFDSIGLVKQHLRAHAQWGHINYGQGKMSFNDYAIRLAAFALVLQQWGHHNEARDQLSKLSTVDSKYAQRIDSYTRDTIELVDYRLRHPDFGRTGCREHTDMAISALKVPAYRAKFLWRTVLDDVARGDLRHVNDIRESYSQLTQTEPVSNANSQLIETFVAVGEGDRDKAMHFATRYRAGLEAVWRNRPEVPYLAVHGLFAGLSFEANIHLHSWRLDVRHRDSVSRLARFLSRLAVFRRTMDLGARADGMRELDTMLRLLPDHACNFDSSIVDGAIDTHLRSPFLSALCDELQSIISEA